MGIRDKLAGYSTRSPEKSVAHPSQIKGSEFASYLSLADLRGVIRVSAGPMQRGGCKLMLVDQNESSICEMYVSQDGDSDLFLGHGSIKGQLHVPVDGNPVLTFLYHGGKSECRPTWPEGTPSLGVWRPGEQYAVSPSADGRPVLGIVDQHGVLHAQIAMRDGGYGEVEVKLYGPDDRACSGITTSSNVDDGLLTMGFLGTNGGVAFIHLLADGQLAATILDKQGEIVEQYAGD